MWRKMMLVGGATWSIGSMALAAAGEHATEAAAGGDMTHRMMMLAIQLGLLLFVARLGNIVFEKLRLPGVLGELCGGILVGPFMLGKYALPGFPHGVFPISSPDFPISPELYGFCSVAAIVLLFMVGLETDIKLFMRYSLAGTMVGIGGVVFSFIFGDLLAVFLLPMLQTGPHDFFSPPCIFLGIMSTATSVGITARILSEKRKLESPEGVTILAGAVFDDVLGIVLLAVGLGVISASKGPGGIDWAHIGVIAAKAIGIWLAATIIGLMAARRISLLLKRFRDQSSIATLALGLALILSGLFEEAKLAMIIGAYVMGLSLSRTDISHVIQENLRPVYALLVPVFFTVMGMLVNVELLGSKTVLGFGLLYTVAAALAKILGCGIPSLFCNFNLRGAARIGFGMLPRGEVALIIAGIGLAAGLLSQEVFGVGVMMTLLTTLLAPPTLVALFKSPASGLRKPVADARTEPIVFTFPSTDTAELLVNKLVSAFEREGFFVHTLNNEDHIMQLRKDNVVIGFQWDGPTIVFDCDAREAVFVSTAMIEVLAEFEQAIRELRRPIDHASIVRRLNTGAGPSAKRPSLAQFITADALIPDLHATTKEEAIDELLQALDRCNLLRSVTRAHDAVLEREKSMSTGMQDGVAIPHARTDAVDKLVCAIGMKPDGIDFAALDGLPSTIFVLTLSPRQSTAPHMQFMATVSNCLDERGRRALLMCRTASAMHRVLTGDLAILDGAPTAPVSAPPTPATSSASATIRQFVRRDCLTATLAGTTKQAVLDELIGMLAASGVIRDVMSVREAIFAREHLMSTGMEAGIAIPHARTSAVTQLVCAIGIHPTGIDFDSMDGLPSRIFVLTLSPRDAPAPHVQFMATISRLLDDEGRKRLLAATNVDELWNVLCGA